MKLQKPLEVETCEHCGQRSAVAETIFIDDYTLTVCRKCYFQALQQGEIILDSINR